jgi:hypothetical protein
LPLYRPVTSLPVVSLERVGLVVGGVICLVVTPFLALAYYPAFGSYGETPPPWADWISWPTPITGDAVSVYNGYGTIYGLALVVVVVSLAVLVRNSTALGTETRGSLIVLVGGLGAVAVGSVLEYGLEFLPGFGLEILGFLVLIGGMVLLGMTLRREFRLAQWKSVVVSLSGFVAVLVGTGLVGHLPSGPALLFVVACVAVGFMGLRLPGGHQTEH